MRAVVQRVARAAVRVDGRVVGEIGPGLVALIGVGRDDDRAAAERMAEKLRHLRVLADSEAVMNLSVTEAGAPILVVSQFTLYGDTSRGRRPSWASAAPPEQAEPLVDAVVAALRSAGVDVATGQFRAHMDVELVNDGPVTVLLEV